MGAEGQDPLPDTGHTEADDSTRRRELTTRIPPGYGSCQPQRLTSFQAPGRTSPAARTLIRSPMMNG